MSNLNLHIYPSPFKFESRILRETKSIIDYGLADNVIIASGWSAGMHQNEQIDGGRAVKRFKLFFDRFKKNSLISILKYFEFIVRVVAFYKREKVEVVNCHSLFVLPVGYLLKFFNYKVWLIYDAHELESEKAGLNKISKGISSLLEKFLIKKVDKVIVVSPSIARWYENKYGISNVVVIRNTPDLTNNIIRNSIFNDTFGIAKDSIIFIYQGVVNRGRGIELLINVFSQIQSHMHLVIMGYGPLVNFVKKAEKNHRNIHFLPAVPPSEISYYTSGADIGLSMIENISLSYYYCLPNKLFEYLHSGLPVIVSDFPDMAAIINKYACGWTSEVSEIGLLNTINRICKEEIADKKTGVYTAKSDINWEKESLLLFEVFKT